MSTYPELTEAQQKANRELLIDHLTNNVTDDQYNHNTFSANGQACALGHAAKAGIAGLSFKPYDVKFSGTDCDGYPVYHLDNGEVVDTYYIFCDTDEDHEYPTGRYLVDVLFGLNARRNVFNCNLQEHTRTSAIEALKALG